MHQFNWTPGIGDPTFGGWLTVGLYFVTAFSTSLTAIVILDERRLWSAISIAFVALAFNKQLTCRVH